ncbi:YmfQ family protein [Undibacterium sp. SXout11W]|uniref:YmfQ family protein n=1 Tax=Undibacterium sp. SXout11W TaxID=3413050 RepID=UPI003BF2FB99
MSDHVQLLKQLLPPVSYDKNAILLGIEIQSEGTQLNTVEAFGDALLLEADPRTTDLLLSDFERVYGLPDDCCGTSNDEASRRKNLIAKIAEVGGLSKSYFIGLATALGETNVTIRTYKPSHCEISCESILVDESFRVLWEVNIPNRVMPRKPFRAGSRCGSRVDTYTKGRLECLLMRLKPAHTYVKFNYL